MLQEPFALPTMAGVAVQSTAQHREAVVSRQDLPALSDVESKPDPTLESLPLFTDLCRKWELDAFNPSFYRASIFYMRPGPQYEAEKPYFMNIPVDPAWLPTVKQTNVSYTRKTVAVADIRGHESLFSLDTNGFQLGQLKSNVPYDGFADTDTIISRYYDEVKLFLINYTGAVEVLPFDFQVRRLFIALLSLAWSVAERDQRFAAVIHLCLITQGGHQARHSLLLQCMEVSRLTCL